MPGGPNDKIDELLDHLLVLERQCRRSFSGAFETAVFCTVAADYLKYAYFCSLNAPDFSESKSPKTIKKRISRIARTRRSWNETSTMYDEQTREWRVTSDSTDSDYKCI